MFHKLKVYKNFIQNDSVGNPLKFYSDISKILLILFSQFCPEVSFSFFSSFRNIEKFYLIITWKFKEIKEKNYEILKKKSANGWESFRKFYIIFGESLHKICGISKLISKTFESKNFRIIKSRSSGNHGDQNFEKNLRKIW